MCSPEVQRCTGPAGDAGRSEEDPPAGGARGLGPWAGERVCRWGFYVCVCVCVHVGLGDVVFLPFFFAFAGEVTPNY